MREDAQMTPVVVGVDADTAAAQEFVGSLIEQALTMNDLIVERWMGVGVSVRVSDPDPSSSDTLGLTIAGHNGPTEPQDMRDILQMAIDSLDATHGTGYEFGAYAPEEPS